MKQEVPSPSPEPPPAGPRRRFAWVWRILAILVILGGALVAADYFRSAGQTGAQAGRAAGAGDNTAFSPTLPPTGGVPGDVPGRAASEADLRLLAGFLMNAADQDAAYNDPKIKDPKERQRILSDFFKLPFKNPQSEAPEDMVPPQAQVLAVFDSPEEHGARMVLLRMKVGVEQAISEIRAKYAAAGWTTPDPLMAGRQTDEGWMVRFTQKGRERIIYARPRPTADETLVAVYDAPH